MSKKYSRSKKSKVSDTKTATIAGGPANMSRTPKISVCMMVKNEAKNLPRLLDSVVKMGLDDEICIFDTGSSDNTLEICKSYNAKMIELNEGETLADYYEKTEFGDMINFSKARNKSMSTASGDWLLLLDADESLEGSAKELRKFLRQLPAEYVAIALLFKDMQSENEHVRFPPPRIYRKGEVHFESIVHNKPVFKEPAIFFEGLEVHHYGFDFEINPEMKQAKYERTLGLLRKRLADNPTDYQVYFYLAMLEGDHADFERCVEFCVKYIRNKEAIGRFNPSIYFTLVQSCMASDNRELADKWLGEALRELPADVDIAMAAVDYGVWQEKPHVVSMAAEKFVAAYEQMKADPLHSGSRFCFNFSEKALVKVLFHLAMIRLSQGVNVMAKLEETTKALPEDLAAAVKEDINNNLNKIDGKVAWISFDKEKI
jgi:glycosyltransferase involved in cell wall biosynthesis